MNKLCAQCQEKPVRLATHIYCSRACYHESCKRQVEKVCIECKSTFSVAASRTTVTKYRAGIFCSKVCAGRALGRSAQHNGKRRYEHNGYVYVRAFDHPNRIKNGYIAEHRLVMEKILGRHMLKSESVHHINGVKNDNRPENLALVAAGLHLGNMDCPSCGYHFKIR